MTKNHSFLSYYILEIKWRFFYFLISFGITFFLACYFSKILLFYITDPAIIMKDFSILLESLKNLNLLAPIGTSGTLDTMKYDFELNPKLILLDSENNILSSNQDRKSVV